MSGDVMNKYDRHMEICKKLNEIYIKKNHDYGDAFGVQDAAAEVRALRAKGIHVSAVFMGESSSASHAAVIYGKELARIKGIDQLAKAAGILIQHEIRSLED